MTHKNEEIMKKKQQTDPATNVLFLSYAFKA